MQVDTSIEVCVNMTRNLSEGYRSRMFSRGKVVRVTPGESVPGSALMAASLSHGRIFRD